MDYRTLGRSGCAVSTLTLGTMTFGNESDEDVSHAQLDRFIEVGGTLIDTADVYSRGLSEEIIGRWLARQPAEVRSQVVLATKGRFAMGDGENDLGLSRRHLREALDASLKRLGVDSRRPLPGARLRSATPRWTRRCASSTTPSRPGRSPTSGSPTTRAGRSRRSSTWPTSAGSPGR